MFWWQREYQITRGITSTIRLYHIFCSQRYTVHLKIWSEETGLECMLICSQVWPLFYPNGIISYMHPSNCKFCGRGNIGQGDNKGNYIGDQIILHFMITIVLLCILKSKLKLYWCKIWILSHWSASDLLSVFGISSIKL